MREAAGGCWPTELASYWGYSTGGGVLHVMHLVQEEVLLWVVARNGQ